MTTPWNHRAMLDLWSATSGLATGAICVFAHAKHGGFDEDVLRAVGCGLFICAGSGLRGLAKL